MITVSLHQPYSGLLVVPGWVFAIIGIAAGIVVHELGHLMMATVFRLSPRVISVGVGPVVLDFWIGKVFFEFRALPTSGYVSVLPLLRRRRVALSMVILGGVLANAILFSIAAAMSAAHSVPDHALQPFAWAQVYLIVGNLLPWKDSDGMQILRVLFQRGPDTLLMLYKTLLTPRATREQIAAGPSPAFAEFAYHYSRLHFKNDEWVRHAALEGLRRTLCREDLAPVERSFALDSLITYELFDQDGALDLIRIENWSSEALALAPSHDTVMTRGGVLIILGHAEEGRNMLATVADVPMEPIVRVFYCACRAVAEATLDNGVEAQCWVEQADAINVSGQSRPGVQKLLDRARHQTLTATIGK